MKMKKTPSIKKLSLVFSEPTKAKEVMRMTRQQLMETEAGQWRINNCLNPPANYDLRLTVLNALDSAVFGVESIKSEKGEYASYINTGDFYNPTVIYWRGNYRVQSLGDFIETMEKQGIMFD